MFVEECEGTTWIVAILDPSKLIEAKVEANVRGRAAKHEYNESDPLPVSFPLLGGEVICTCEEYHDMHT